MKLPDIEKSNKKSKYPSLIKEKYKIILEQNNYSPAFKSNSFLTKMKDIKEIKIYLKEKFLQSEIDEQFLKDIEKEYAEQYLLKMKIFPTKMLIKRILNLCPLKNCDFQLYDEIIYINNIEKNVKSLHIFPIFERKGKKVKNFFNNIKTIKTDNFYSRNNRNIYIKNRTSTLHKNIKNKNFIISLNKKNNLSIETSPISKKNFFSTEDNFTSNKKNNMTIDDNASYLYNREKIDDIFAKYRESVTNLQLFSNKKSIVKIDLTPQNIRNNYLVSESNWSNKIFENKGKLSKISKSILSYKNILNNKKYFFDIKNIKNLTIDIIQEIKEPINPQIELVIKDINYILDNFPFEEFIDIKNNENINENNTTLNRDKIVIKSKKDFLLILKELASNNSCRILVLCINLIYWIIFGDNNTIQIDSNTKELIYLKLIKEWEIISSKFNNKTIFYKIYIPLFIIICRIEIENFFVRKYIYLFEDKNNLKIFLKKANAIITEIFDKHGYMNTFNLFCKDQEEFNKKFRINNNNNIGHYKNKLYATSNFVEMLFRNDNENLKNDNDIKEKEEFISKHKEKYFSFYLDKINNQLKRRNLEPIFKIKNKPKELKEEINILGIKPKEINENINR